MNCCFCDKKLDGIGNSPWPFLRLKEEGTGCCDNCDQLFVYPARIIYERYKVDDKTWDRALSVIRNSIKDINQEEKNGV